MSVANVIQSLSKRFFCTTITKSSTCFISWGD